MAIFEEFMHLCKHHLTLKFYIFFRLQVKCQILVYKFPQNNLYSYNMIAHSLRKIHISENREKKNCSKIDIYQGVN